MPRPIAEPSLRRSLILSVLAVVVAGSLTMALAFSAMQAMRQTIDRDTNAILEEQRRADEIIALTYQQQLEAYRYLQSPEPAGRASFQSLGDRADARMREYLFHQLSRDARLQVEVMKEAHASFEVAAQQALDLAERGDVAGARVRLSALRARATALDTSVASFFVARGAQRALLLTEYERVYQRVRLGMIVVGLAILVLGLLLSRHLRRLVVLPLEELIVAASRIRAGDKHVRVAPQRFAELRRAATEFNLMADAVQTSRETVEMQNEELRQSLEQLQDTQEELVQHEKLSAMGQMLAGLAHELNNPLGGVLGLAQLLRQELAAPRPADLRRLDAELAAPIEREAIRARDLVRSMLNFARKPSGVIEPVSLAAATSTVAGLRAHAYAMAEKMLRVDIPDDVFVMADMQKLQHAIVNVVNNALDAMVEGGGNSLRVSASAVNDATVAMHFDDDGPGFANARAAFDPFYTTKRAGHGTGLGLSLVEQFVNEFGGSVSAANRAEGGARVTLIFRRAPAPAAWAAPASSAEQSDGAPAPVATATSSAPGPEAQGGAAAPARARILVVDDEVSLREVQRRLLMLEGYDVLLADSVEAAMQVLAREHVDLVVSDLRMPGSTDGRGLLDLLDERHPALAGRALIVTGDASGLGGARLPLDRIINKPFTRAEYVERIRAALRGAAAPT